MARQVLSSRMEVVSTVTRPARAGEVVGSTIFKQLAPRRELQKFEPPAEIVERERDNAAIRAAGRAELALKYQTDPVYQFVERQKDRVRTEQDRHREAGYQLLEQQFGVARAAEFAKEASAARLRTRLALRVLGGEKLTSTE